MSQHNDAPPKASMTDEHKIVVIGGSSGSLAPLRAVLRSLPKDLPASIFVTLHLAVSSRPVTQVVRDSSPFPVVEPRDRELWRGRTLYVATPNEHLMFDSGGVLRVLHGPRENAARPSIDALFRSAAVHHGARVVGLLLSGRLFDGAAGLAAIERCGGVTVVQDPGDAGEPELPLSALSTARVDYCLPAADIGAQLVELVRVRSPASAPVPAAMANEARLAIAAGEGPARVAVDAPSLTCPACDGPLAELGAAGMARFRCEVGHAYNPESLLLEQGRMVERALWIALRTLQERAILLSRMALEAQRRGHAATAGGFDERRREIEENLQTIRSAIGVVTSERSPPIAAPALES